VARAERTTVSRARQSSPCARRHAGGRHTIAMASSDPTGHRFFLSYRREDAAGHAGRLADHLLDRFGAGSVFMDVESIAAGADFAEAIERALADAGAVLVVIGPGWLDATGPTGNRRLEDPGDFVRREVEAALQFDVRVIPLLVGGATMPPEEHLPGTIAALAGRNALELQDRRWREDVDALVDVLEGRGRARVGNLPAQPTPFLGRKRELADVIDLLRRQDVRLLTLTGPGGIGKTRLAVQAATKVAQSYPGGAWFVGLAALADPALVLGEIARELDVPERGEDSLAGVLATRLSRARTLMVLDNLEQLLPDAAAPIAELSAAAPSLDLIVSSREPLHVAAEREYLLATLSEEEATALFVERARAVRAHFEPQGEAERRAIAGICARLDRLPLALELAAARIKLLEPSELLRRLEQRLPLLTGGARDAPERQQTLRATIAWSHDLLTQDERVLFERLAVFSGGWTLEAAEAVCDADLDSMQSLIERNLVRESTGEPRRYEMLETIREFAIEILRGRGQESELTTRHEDYFLSLALQVQPHLRGPDPGPWFDRLEIELRNLGAAIDSSLTHGRDEVALRLATASAKLWEHRGHWREGRAWLDAVLARSNSMRVSERARALLAAGNLAAFQGEMAVSRSLLEQAVELAREVNDPGTLALALSCLAWVAGEQGLDVAQSVALGKEGVSVARDLGEPWVLAESLTNLAAGLHSGLASNLSFAEGLVLFEEGLDLRRSIRDATSIADSLNNLGFGSILGEDYPKAFAYLQESLQRARRLNDKPQIVLARDNLALAHLFDGNPGLADELFRENLRLCWEIGDRRVGREALMGLAGGAAVRGEWVRAAWLAGASTGLATEGAPHRNDAEVRVDERYLSDAREALSPGSFEASFELGGVATFEEAVSYALGESGAD
jgi:predicted ATPase